MQQKNGTITVEDYCKWYSLYRIHRVESNNIVVSSYKNDDILSHLDEDWCMVTVQFQSVLFLNVEKIN